MPDREKVIAWLADEESYYREHGDTHNRLMARDALALIDMQYKLIFELQNLISIGTKMMNGDEANKAE